MLKEEVLSLLLNAREPVSGEGICKTLGVTPRPPSGRPSTSCGKRAMGSTPRRSAAIRSHPFQTGSIRLLCAHTCPAIRGRRW